QLLPERAAFPARKAQRFYRRCYVRHEALPLCARLFDGQSWAGDERTSTIISPAAVRCVHRLAAAHCQVLESCPGYWCNLFQPRLRLACRVLRDRLGGRGSSRQTRTPFRTASFLLEGLFQAPRGMSRFTCRWPKHNPPHYLRVIISTGLISRSRSAARACR